MNDDMKLYYDYTVSPLGRLFYKTICKQLEHIKGKKILDFGSGFGFSANFLAKSNEVVAIEPDASMIAVRASDNAYTQICGDLSQLANFSDESFDVVLCHLVFEFVDNPQKILNTLLRVLKKGGLLSIVRHNKNGRIIQAIVQECNLEDAHALLDGGYSYSSAFGDIKYYTNNDLLDWLNVDMQVENIFGARALASLHSLELQNQENWLEKMFALEWRLLADSDFIKIAYFNHLILSKK